MLIAVQHIGIIYHLLAVRCRVFFGAYVVRATIGLGQICGVELVLLVLG